MKMVSKVLTGVMFFSIVFATLTHESKAADLGFANKGGVLGCGLAVSGATFGWTRAILEERNNRLMDQIVNEFKFNKASASRLGELQILKKTTISTAVGAFVTVASLLGGSVGRRSWTLDAHPPPSTQNVRIPTKEGFQNFIFYSSTCVIWIRFSLARFCREDGRDLHGAASGVASSS